MQSEHHIDGLTVAGLGALLMPLLTMWHEIGGHAAMCAVQGGKVSSIGAFYVTCTGLSGADRAMVACAGVLVNILLALTAYLAWRRASGDTSRLILWLIWVSQGFVAAGYLIFSGASGMGDLGIAAGGALHDLGLGTPVRAAELAIGLASYAGLVRLAIGTLGGMLGKAPETRRSRRMIAHVYYATASIGAVLVGLLNPLGVGVAILSAAASTVGGLAGFISIGTSSGKGSDNLAFRLKRNPAIIAGGAVALLAFALVLGPSISL